MFDPQTIVFREALHWPVGTGVFCLAFGALFILQGFRFARFLLALSAGSFGFLVGYTTRFAIDLPPMTAALAGAGVFGVMALFRLRLSMYINGFATLGILGLFVAARIDLHPEARLIAGALGAAAGMMVPAAAGRSAPIVLSALQGSMLAMTGFVCVAAELAPALADTFVEWSSHSLYISPALLTMLVVLGYSTQANMLQGDITTGGSFGDLYNS